MPFEPTNPLGGFTGIAEPQEPEKFTDVNPETRPFQPQQPGLWGAAFRTENTIGSSISSETVRTEREQRGVFGGPVKIDPDFDPWAEIAGTPYEPYYEQFAAAGNKTHFEAIRADIDRENKDRDVISKSGLAGMGAAMAAGTLDLPILVPGGAILRSASGGVSILKTAATTAVAGATAASLSELTLQGTQQLRTAEESAMVIGGSVVLSGLLGAGFGKLFSRLEQGGLAARVEQDFLVPGLDRLDPYSPGSIKVDAAPGASEKAAQVADAIRETAEQLLPPSVRVQVVDSIDIATGGKYGLRAYHGTPHDVDRFDMSKIGTGEGAQVYGHGLYFAENELVADSYRIGLTADKITVNGKEVAGDDDLLSFVSTKLFGKDPYGQTIDDLVVAAEYNLAQLRAMPEPSDADATGLMVSLARMKARHAENIAEAEAYLAKAKEVQSGEIKTTGNLYEVDLKVEPEDLLDWDAPLSQQSEKIRAALFGAQGPRSGKPDNGKAYDRFLKKVKSDDSGSVELDSAYDSYIGVVQSLQLEPMSRADFKSKLIDSKVRISQIAGRDRLIGVATDLPRADRTQPLPGLTGGEFVQRLGKDQEASQKLLALGIPGIRYLDQGSRDAGEGSRNIVIFDDSLITITKKNGEAVTGAERQKIVDEMFGLRQREGGERVAEGRFDPENLMITIAADALDPVKTLKHESIHALRTTGLFNPKEWATLENAARKQGWIETTNVRQTYDGVYSQGGRSEKELSDLLTEEAIAEQFSLWRRGEAQFSSAITKLFQRVKDFLDRISNALRGRGFQTADDVFAAVDAGRVKSRADAALPGLPRAAGAATGVGGGKSVGAAARDSVDNTLKSAFGLEKAAAFMVPELRLFTSKSDVTKRYAQELYETALAFKKNAAGNETAPLGTELGAPGAVETRVKFWQAPLAEAASAVDDAFFKYRKGRQKRMVGELSAVTLKDTIFGTEALTYRGFKEEISKAMRRLDKHEIPEVAQAAKIIRQKVLDPLKDEAIAAKLLPEDIDPETAPSYLNRIYNRERIIAERDQFKAVIRDWLEETETNNAAVRARVSTALGTLKSEQEAIKRIEAKIARRKASGKEADIEGLQIEIDEINLRVKDLTKQIEAEVVKYQGKSAKEAQRAVDQRTEAEGMRDADAPELRAADKPVMQAAKKIARQVDKEPAELDDLADQIIDRLIGTPEGRLPYDAHMDTVNKGGVSQQVRGPLNARVFMIPDRLIEPWLENDAEALMRAYVRTMAPDVELTKRFGSADMTLQMKEIQDDYARRSAAATSPEQRKKINAQKNADLRDLGAVRDRLRGMYRLPSDPDAIMVRAGRVIGSWNFMRMLGGMTVSAVPDLARPIMVHGVMRTFGDGLFPLMTNWSNAKLAMKEVKLAGTALDMVLDSRAMRIADVVDEFGRGTKFERAVQSGARNFGIVSLMAPWNAAIKQFAGLITMSRILQTADALAKGKIKPKDLEALAAGGISELNARKIAEQFKKYGVKQGTVWMPNTHRWDADARPAMEAFRAALVRDVDRIIVTPGIADRPLWMSYELGRLVGQFKSFAIASMQKTLISGLQQSDTSVLAGVALMTALGGLVHVVKARGGDHDPGVPKEWGMNKETSQFMVNAVDRAGLTGWLMEFNNMSEKVSRGTVGLSALTGKPVGRYASRNITASMLGPSVGTVEDFIRVTGAAVEGEWNAADSRTMKRLIPYNNVFTIRSIFDNAQTNIDSYFGVPERSQRR